MYFQIYDPVVVFICCWNRHKVDGQGFQRPLRGPRPAGNAGRLNGRHRLIVPLLGLTRTGIEMTKKVFTS